MDGEDQYEDKKFLVFSHIVAIKEKHVVISIVHFNIIFLLKHREEDEN